MTLAVKTRFIETVPTGTSELLATGLIETRVFSNPFVNERDPNFSESRIKIRYELSSQLKEHFVLLRGLIEFSRPKDFSFVFNRNENSFVASITRNQVANLKELLSNVQFQLNAELKFRKKLKTAIYFERQYRLQCEAMYRAHALAS